MSGVFPTALRSKTPVEGVFVVVISLCSFREEFSDASSQKTDKFQKEQFHLASFRDDGAFHSLKSTF